ncbi:hypothetical protein [Flavivirga jejuensis]|uniref:Lipoprotein n=1 Tax=Flavivirga jejuensis TaxID=870487 RepID=A0ABT8WKV1_9FLAO|nr:hypothetical protein [Flavivirga jejuensis]MDO5973614.1 hypothetical protein [Flavivirga jejuensis]
MNKFKILAFTLLVILSCKSVKLKKSFHNNSGNYVSEHYQNRESGYDWVSVNVSQNTPENMKISIRSRADKKRPTCTFDAIAERINDSTFQTIVKQKTILFKFKENNISISTKEFDNRFLLMYFCSGGASLMGDYKKISSELDTTQIDKKPFSNMIKDGKINR